jgi:hypothetical protein
MHVAALDADVTGGTPLREPLEPEETRACVVHRNRAFKELRATAMVAFQLTIIDRDFLRFTHTEFGFVSLFNVVCADGSSDRRSGRGLPLNVP